MSPYRLIPCDTSKKHCVCIRRGSGSGYPDDRFIYYHESDNCENGEVCARINNVTYAPYNTKMVPSRASETFLAATSWMEEGNKLPGSGLASDVYRMKSQRKAPRTCRNFTGASLMPCNGYREQRNSCACLDPYELCRHKFHCYAGEVCAEVKGQSMHPGCQSEEKFTFTCGNYSEAD